MLYIKRGYKTPEWKFEIEHNLSLPRVTVSLGFNCQLRPNYQN